MRMGFRTPSISKSVSARTSGRLNRTVKSVNPVYGSKGIGLVHDPKRAVYNSIYHETTVGVSDLGSEPPPSDPPNEPPRIEPPDEPPKKPIYKKWWFWVIVILFACAAGATGGKKQPEQVTEATPTPTEQPTPKPTPAPTAEPTEKPTPTPGTVYVYVAASGNGECYHFDKNCSQMNGNVKRMKLKKAKKKYRPCSRCGGAGL